MTSMMLETERISKRFDGLVAVDAVDLFVERGEIRGIVGPNGAGKTTLFNLVSGLYGVTGGRIRLDGRDITGVSPHARAAAGLGRTYQTPQIFPELSIFDNVAVGLAGARPPSLRDALVGRRRLRRDVETSVKDTLDYVRPMWKDGRLTLVTRPAPEESLAPFELKNSTPCCADH